jgi:hypothetical protein
MNAKLIPPFLALFLFAAAPVFSDTDKFCIQPYISDTQSAAFAASLTESLKTVSSWPIIAVSPDKHQVFPEGENQQETIDTIADAGSDAGTDRVLAGSITKYGEWFLIDSIIISVSDKKILYSSTLPVKADAAGSNHAADILGRIKLFTEGKTFPVTNLAATQGYAQPFTKLTWDAVPDCALYEILSSIDSETGPFIPAGTTKNPAFFDTDAKPGRKTWYAISPVIDKIRTEPSAPASGYRKQPFPKEDDLRTIIGSFNRPYPRMTAAEAKKAAADTAYLKQWYQNATKLNLILYMSRDYIQKKELYVLRGSDNYEFSIDGREIRISPAGAKYRIVFKNGTFHRRVASRNDRELTDRLLKNALLFCIPAGDVETTDEEGNTVYLPRFDVITMCTTYFYNTADWNSTTLLYTTVDDSLKVKVDKEKKKIEDQNSDQ